MLTNDKKPLIIAEIGQSHDGSLGTAHAYIDALSEIGVDAVKYQTHIASEESSFSDQFRVNFSYQDNSRYEYWKRMEFTELQWKGLYDHACSKGIHFLSTPFSVAAVELLDRIGVNAWKIGSGDTNNYELLDAVLKTKKMILLSTGLSVLSEIDDVVSFIQSNEVSFALFQCTSKYPTSYKDIGINLIQVFSDRYGCPVGLSDHSGSIYPSLLALANGAKMIELHVVFDKRQFGPDTKSSITLSDMRYIVEARDAFFQMQSNPVNKSVLTPELKQTKQLFSRSLSPKHELEAGTVIEKNMLISKKPGGGIDPRDIESIIGKTVKTNLSPDQIIYDQDLE